MSNDSLTVAAGAKNPAEFSGRDARAYQRLFSKDNDWPFTPVKRRYVLMSTPRTGSTMLCSALIASGLGGHPVEYLSPKNIDLYRRVRGSVSIAAIWQDYQSRRTSPNGYFGTKLHYSQFERLFGKTPQPNGMDFIRSFDRHILCFRRDKIDQAISRLLAAETGGEWSGGQAEVTSRASKPDDNITISKHVANMTRDEGRWRKLMAVLKLKVHEVAYEDLASETAAVLTDTFDFLGIHFERTSVPMPTTRKLPSSVNRELRIAYLAAGKGQLPLTP